MNVLVINARGLHLGYPGPYGNDWIDTPAFDRLAAEGVVFDHHFADRPDAEGACASWRGGRYRIPTPEGPSSPAAPEADLIPLLRRHGVFTSLVRDGGRPAPPSFAEGWDAVAVSKPGDEGTAMEYALDAWQGALDALPTSGGWLVWLELATALPPWDMPDGYRVRYLTEEPDEDAEEGDPDEDEVLEPLEDFPEGLLDPLDDETFVRLQRGYAGVVTYLDAGLNLIREELERRGLLDNVLLLVTSDCGLPLGEHGAVGPCRPWPHDELAHVPLMMRWPGRLTENRRVTALTQAVDVMPTLLDAFGVAAPDVHGHSLLPLARGEAERVRAYAVSGLALGGSSEWALRTPEWAYLLPVRAGVGDAPRAARLYVRPDDRWEVNDVAQHHPALCDHLGRVLREFVGASHSPGPLRAPELRDVEAEAPGEAT